MFVIDICKVMGAFWSLRVVVCCSAFQVGPKQRVVIGVSKFNLALCGAIARE